MKKIITILALAIVVSACKKEEVSPELTRNQKIINAFTPEQKKEFYQLLKKNPTVPIDVIIDLTLMQDQFNSTGFSANTNQIW